MFSKFLAIITFVFGGMMGAYADSLNNRDGLSKATEVSYYQVACKTTISYVIYFFSVI